MNGYNVILVTDTTDYPKWTRDYGVHRLASHIRENGYTCLVVDFCSEATWEQWQDICKYAIGSDTMVLGFGSTWWPYRRPFFDNKTTSRKLDLFRTTTVEEVFPNGGLLYDAVKGTMSKWVDEAKLYNPKLKVIMGGGKIDHYIDAPIDHFFVGLSETQIIDYLKSLTGKKRLWPRFIEHDTTASNPDWDFKLSSTSYQEEDCMNHGEFVSIEFARGCRFKCSFCAYPLIGRKDVSNYLKDKEVLYKEFMENYEKWGITTYRVADDTLNDSTEKLIYIEEVVKRLPFKLKLRAFVRLDVITTNLEQIDLLKNIGLYAAWIGIDSMHPVASKIIGKGQYAEKKKDTLIKMREAWGKDVWVECGYILGLPKEDSQFVREFVNWVIADNSPVDLLQLSPLLLNAIPEKLPHYPMSELDRNYKKYGYEIPDQEKHLFWTKDDGTDIKSFIDAAALSNELHAKMKRKENPHNFHETAHNIKDPQTEYFPKLIKILQNKFDNR